MNRSAITDDNNIPNGVACMCFFYSFPVIEEMSLTIIYSSAVQVVVLDLPLADGNLITLDILQIIIVWIFFKAA
jgi:hypothetical protein